MIIDNNQYDITKEYGVENNNNDYYYIAEIDELVKQAEKSG